MDKAQNTKRKCSTRRDFALPLGWIKVSEKKRVLVVPLRESKQFPPPSSLVLGYHMDPMSWYYVHTTSSSH